MCLCLCDCVKKKVCGWEVDVGKNDELVTEGWFILG